MTITDLHASMGDAARRISQIVAASLRDYTDAYLTSIDQNKLATSEQRWEYTQIIVAGWYVHLHTECASERLTELERHALRWIAFMPTWEGRDLALHQVEAHLIARSQGVAPTTD